MELIIVMLLFGGFSASTMVIGRVKTQLFGGARHMCLKCGLNLDAGRSICPVCGKYLAKAKH
jgi:predicted amidophosphoribosyltransferase